MSHAIDEIPLPLRAEIDELPALPAVVSACLDELHDPSSNAQRVADLMLADVGLTARALKVVNSSLFCLATEVRSLAHAIALLGAARLEEIILSVTLPQLFGKGRAGALVTRVWEHAFATAFMGREVAVRAGLERPTDAYVAGLMHDLGLMIAARCLPVETERMVAAQPDAGPWDLATERAALETDHARLGLALAEHWGLPEAILEAVRHHHDPAGHDPMVAAVHVADRLAEQGGLGLREVEADPEPPVARWWTAAFPPDHPVPDDLDLFAAADDWGAQVRALVAELVPASQP